jgi:hypothetical protein
MNKKSAFVRLLNVALTVLFAVSIAGLVLGHEPWRKILYDLAVGALITIFFYLLVVRLPERERRQRLKRSLEKHYYTFREDCIGILLMAADDTYCAGFPETLMDQDRFREYFNEKVRCGGDRWDDFQNNLNETHLQHLLTYMEIFREELVFVLNNVDIPETEPFEFLKRLSAIIYSMKRVKLGYDETKPLASFLWDVFAGWDLITGYRKEDIIKNMIAAI